MLGLKTPGAAFHEAELDLNKRLATLEAAKASDAKAGTAKVADLSARLDSLDGVATSIEQLKAAQSALAAESKAAADAAWFGEFTAGQSCSTQGRIRFAPHPIQSGIST